MNTCPCCTIGTRKMGQDATVRGGGRMLGPSLRAGQTEWGDGGARAPLHLFSCASLQSRWLSDIPPRQSKWALTSQSKGRTRAASLQEHTKSLAPRAQACGRRSAGTLGGPMRLLSRHKESLLDSPAATADDKSSSRPSAPRVLVARQRLPTPRDSPTVSSFRVHLVDLRV